EDDGDADQAERGQRAARGEDQRQHDERDRGDQPDAVEAQGPGLLVDHVGCGGCGVCHVSRVPNRPIGRTIRIRTRRQEGRIGAICAIVTFQMSDRTDGPRLGSSGPNALASDPFSATAKVWISPIRSEAMKAPGSEPRPPNTMTTNRIGPSIAAILD